MLSEEFRRRRIAKAGDTLPRLRHAPRSQEEELGEPSAVLAGDSGNQDDLFFMREARAKMKPCRGLSHHDP